VQRAADLRARGGDDGAVEHLHEEAPRDQQGNVPMPRVDHKFLIPS